jgi:hypothetical protein
MTKVNGAGQVALTPEKPHLQVFHIDCPKVRAHTAEQALQHQTYATRRRALALTMTENGDHTGAHLELAEAEKLEASAAKFLDPGTHVTGPQKIGNGGEMVVATHEASENVPGIIDTLRQSPDMLNALASRERLELASLVGMGASTDVLTLAVDAADTIGARNSLEKMLAHEMATAHTLAMKFSERAGGLLTRHGLLPKDQAALVEASRAANTAARLMGVFQDGLLTLDRLRRGGKQTVKVVHVHQHVAVQDGGQAVVAGTMKGGRKRAGGGPKRPGGVIGPKRPGGVIRNAV